MNATRTLVLVFSKSANTAQAAKLHASDCSVVAAAASKPMRFQVIRDDLPAVIKDLHERVYPVRRCKCAKGL